MADPPRVAFQGELGAFSEEAVHLLVPGSEPLPRGAFEEVVEAVGAGSAPLGLLPVENTLAGTVAPAYDALVAGAVEVIAEVAIPIRHFLLGPPGASIEGVVEAHSHPVALAQCRRFFTDHPSVAAVPVYDTAGAARAVAREGNPRVAAIASRGAGERYGLDVLVEHLQDRDDNQTRFLLVRRSTSTEAAPAAAAGGLWKTSCIAEVAHKPGALHRLLQVFAERGLDLTHIVSRPGDTPWSYRFILEFRHGLREDGPEALEAAERGGATMRRLGTFPAWSAPATPS